MLFQQLCPCLRRHETNAVADITQKYRLARSSSQTMSALLLASGSQVRTMRLTATITCRVTTAKPIKRSPFPENIRASPVQPTSLRDGHIHANEDPILSTVPPGYYYGMPSSCTSGTINVKKVNEYTR
uniref:Uncharacterized protein n=1 Tax=Ascaris lumbricoides TaxID=6252 RepID=A0A0M3IDV6_ASCLU